MKKFIVGICGLITLISSAQSTLRVVVPIGHTRPITALAVSADDKFMLSGAADNLVHLWSIDAGRLLRTYRGHTGAVSTILISPSGKYFVSIDNNDRGFVRDLITGNVLDSVHLKWGSTVQYANTHDSFVWIDKDSKLHTWEPGKASIILKDTEFQKLCLSGNGQYLLALGSPVNSADPQAKAYMINLRTNETKILGSFMISSGNQLGFTPDGSLALVGDDGNAVLSFSIPSMKPAGRANQGIWLDEFEVNGMGLVKLAGYDGPRLWDPVKNKIEPFTDKHNALFDKTGAALEPLGTVFQKPALDSLSKKNWWLASQFKALPWAEDLYSLPVSEWGSDREQIEVFSRKARFAFWKTPDRTKPLLIHATIAVKLKSKNWVVSSVNRTIVITDLDTNLTIKEFKGIDASAPGNLAFSTDGRLLIYKDRWLRTWNLNQSKLITSKSDSSAEVQLIKPVGQPNLMAVGTNGRVEIRNAEAGTLIGTIESNESKPFGQVRFVGISGDSKFLIWADESQSYIKKMNWENLDWYKQYKILSDSIRINYETNDKIYNSFITNLKGQYLFEPNSSNLFNVFRFEWFGMSQVYFKRQTLNEKMQHTVMAMPATYTKSDRNNFQFTQITHLSQSADASRALLFTKKKNWRDEFENEISWIDLNKPDTGRYVQYEQNAGFFKTKAWRSYFRPRTAAIHATQPWFAASGDLNGDIFTYTFNNDTKGVSFTGHNDLVQSLAFSSNGKLLASGSLDNTVKIWDTETKQELATLVTLGQNDWVVSHPSGLFDASPGGMNFLYFSTGRETIGLEQLKDRFYEPNLLKKIIAGEQLRAVAGLDRIDLYPSIKTTLDTLNAKLTLVVTDQGGGIGKTSVFINAKEAVEDARTLTAGQSKGVLTITLDLAAYKNLVWGDLNFIGVKSYNSSGYIASPMQKIFYTAPQKEQHIKAFEPSLYCLVVGVSDYQNSELNLKYSAKDAHDFAQAVTTGGKRLFGNRVNVTLLSSDAADLSLKPTKGNIDRIMKEIAARAQQQDLVIMYFSGHGTNLSGDEADFLYLTADARGFTFADPAIRQSTTLSSTELTEFMKTINAQKQVLIFDACASGRVVENMLAKRDVPSSTLRAMERLKDRTGTYILSGCAADAVSYEASQFGQGLLTYSLLSGMRGAALRENKFVDILKLFQYAKDEVPKLAENVGGIQEPKVFSPYGGESFDIGLLEDNDKKMIPLTEAKPFFVRTSFQNEIKLRDDIGLSKLVDQGLAEQSHGGKASPLIFIDSQDFPGALYLSGRYKIENGFTAIKLVLFKNDKLLASLDKSINSTDPAKLQAEVLQFISGTLKQKIQ